MKKAERIKATSLPARPTQQPDAESSAKPKPQPQPQQQAGTLKPTPVNVNAQSSAKPQPQTYQQAGTLKPTPLNVKSVPTESSFEPMERPTTPESPLPPQVEISDGLLDSLWIEIVSWGYQDPQRKGKITINNKVYATFSDKGPDPRGIHILTFKPTEQGFSFQNYWHYDVWKDVKNAQRMNEQIRSLPDGTVVVGGSGDEVHKNLSKADEALGLLHLNMSYFSYRGSIAFISKKGHELIDIAYRDVGKGPTKLKKLLIDPKNVQTPVFAGKIKRLDLRQQIKKLKNTSKKTGATVKVLNKAEIFREDDSSSYFPLKKTKSMFEASSGKVLAHLDFTGIDQVTDILFYLIKEQKNLATALAKVEHICIRGCYHVTDLGVYWMTEAFPSLTSVAIDGLPLITERSIHYCLVNLAAIDCISVMGCMVGNPYIPSFFENGMLKFHSCPLILSNSFYTTVNVQSNVGPTDNHLEDLRNEAPLTQYKAVIIKTPEDTEINILGSLNKSGTTSEIFVQALQGYKVSDDKVFNIVECTQDLAEMFVSERTHFILPYKCSEPANQSMNSVLNRMIQTITQVGKGSFTVLPVLGPSEPKSANQNLLVQSDILSKLKEMRKALLQECRRVSEDIYTEAVTFKEQDTLAWGVALTEIIEDMVKDAANKVKVVSKVEDLKKTLDGVLDDCCPQLQNGFPWLTRFSAEFKEFIRVVEHKSGLVTDVEFAKNMMSRDNKGLSPSEDSYVKATEYLHMLGEVVQVKPQVFTSHPGETGIVATDVSWFCNHVNKVLSNKEPDGSHVWENTEKLLYGSSDTEQKKLWKLILKNASLCVQDSSGPVSLSPHLPDKPVVPVEHYFNDYLSGQNFGFNILEKKYEIMQPLPKPFFVKLAGNPVIESTLSWRSGVVKVNHPMECLIMWTPNQNSGLELRGTVCIVCQMPANKQNRMSGQDTLKYEMAQLSALVECLLKHYGLMYKKPRVAFLSDLIDSKTSASGKLAEALSAELLAADVKIGETKNQLEKAFHKRSSLYNEGTRIQSQLEHELSVSKKSKAALDLTAQMDEYKKRMERENEAVKQIENTIEQLTTDREKISKALSESQGASVKIKELSVVRCTFHEDSNRCQMCSTSFLASQLYWQMERNVKPTFGSEIFETTEEIALKKPAKWVSPGSWITVNKRDQLQLGGYLYPSDHNQISFSVKNGKAEKVVIKSAETDSSLTLDTEKCLLEKTDSTNTVSDHWPLQLEKGDIFKVVVYRDQDSKWHVQFVKNLTLVCDVEVPVSKLGYNVCIQTGEMCSLFVDYSTCRMTEAPSSVGLKMRLEAQDRIYPDHICVAQVKDIKPNGEFLVSFDGWTKKYDYWTTLQDPHIHPIGYFDQRANASSKYKGKIKPNLQPPKNYQGAFEWNKYLQEVGAWPIPFHLFSQDQTEGCKPFNLTSETVSVLMTTGTQQGACYSQTMKLAEVQGAIQDAHLVAKTLCEKKIEISSKYIPFRCLLPTPLTPQTVQFPSMQSLLSQDTKPYALCPKHSNQHFINDQNSMGDIRKPVLGSQDAEQSTLTSLNNLYLLATTSKLLDYKEILPAETDQLFPNLRSLKQNEVDRAVRQFLKMFIIQIVIQEDLCYKLNFTQQKDLEKLPEFNQDDASYENKLCKSHYAAEHYQKMGETSFNMKHFQNYEHLVHDLNLGNEEGGFFNSINMLPQDFFQRFRSLQTLQLKDNGISQLPPGINTCTQLKELDLSGNPLKSLTDIGDLKMLESLDISRTNIVNLPEEVYNITSLVELLADDIELTQLKPEIGQLINLEELSLAGNSLSSIPRELSQCKKLIRLNLSGIRWRTTLHTMSMEQLNKLLDEHPLTARMPRQDREKLFEQFNPSRHAFLSEKEIAHLNLHLFTLYPRLKVPQESMNNEEASPLQCLSDLRQLEVLKLSFQALSVVPMHISKIASLKDLDVSHNPILEAVALEISTLEHLTSLNLQACPSLKTPPKEIVNKGFKAVYGYLRRLQKGFVTCKRTKLMLVGLGGAGKTSLVKRLTSKLDSYLAYSHYYNSYDDDYDELETQPITDGIDIVDWRVPLQGGDLTYSIWDFAGQSVYYNTHQFFLSNRAVYLLLWNIRLGFEHAGLDFWLNSISCHAPKAPILVVGTHRDQVDKFWLPQEEIKRKYPQICGFHAVSVLKDRGVKEMTKQLIDVTLQEKYMGEKIPEAWLNFETKMIEPKKKGESLLSWKTVEEMAEQCGINEKSELHQAVGFLHDLGSVQHFKNAFLKSRVVIDPQWIVDAMACVVSVHETPIVDGKFFHKDIAKVWHEYPPELHSWLLRLTEEFDLTFPLHDEPANIVPCLLPPEPPEYTWLNADEIAGFSETKMMYKFDYLPAGLFNRAQVRLYQFSDSSIIWKKGSKLTKNGHHALLLQISDKEVLVKAQGYRPENVIFFVHEVFESLIAESFHGVTYDYFIPCSDCLKVETFETCMFPASKIRRATEMKAPFLQCDNFHALSLTELHACMPPDTHADYDIHLERTVRDLEDIRDDMKYEVFMVYCTKDIPLIGEDRIHPRQVSEDLTNNGFKVWFPVDPSNINIQLVSVTMRDAKVVLVCISDEFVLDQKMCDIFHFAKTNLQKPIQLVVLGNSFEWKNSAVGLLVTDDVFVNMTQPKRYPHKIKELIESVRVKTSIKDTAKTPVQTHPKCFISYAWSNSADAISKGSKGQAGSLGWGDPRAIKEYLEKHNISCWIDVERAGQGGLFEDIADGLKHAKVMVTCVSDEYTRSKNCQLEFRFASITLKIPMVIAVVGTGDKWEASEVGMLSLGNPKVNFQFESPGAYDRLLASVQSALPEDEEDIESRTPSTSDINQAAYQEIKELAQRKFLRRVSTITEKRIYPRLYVLDFLTESEKSKLAPKKPPTDLQEGIPEEDEKETSCPLDEEENEEDDDNQTDTETDATQQETARRPKSALRKRGSGLSVSIAASVMAETDEAKDMTYCLRFLCEHEEGWHTHGPCLPLPLKPDRFEEMTQTVAPYMARLFAILKHTGATLEILSDKGSNIRKLLEEKCNLDSEFGEDYEEFRDFVMQLDKDQSFGELARCHLPSGKIVWLCPTHRGQDDRITVLSKDDNEDIIQSTDDDTVTASMLDHLKEQNVASPPQAAKPQPANIPAGVSTQGQAVPKSPSQSTASSTSSVSSKVKALSAELQSQGKASNAKAAAQVAGGLDKNKSKACTVM